jgi:hypothetical protein
MLQNMIDDICTKDIIPIFSGHEVCEKNHKYGPHIRDYYLKICQLTLFFYSTCEVLKLTCNVLFCSKCYNHVILKSFYGFQNSTYWFRFVLKAYKQT